MAELSREDTEAVTEFMEGRRQLIIRLQESKGLKASGYSARMLSTRQRGNVFELVDGSGSFEFQEFGRRGGKVPYNFFKIIYEWLAYKKYGLNYKNDKKRISLAWAIVMKIKKSGTYTKIQNRETGVLKEAISSEVTKELIDKIVQNSRVQILTDIKRILV